MDRPHFHQQTRLAAERELDATAELIELLPELEGLRPGAIVTWHRERDDSYGTHLAYLDESGAVIFIWGHYDFRTYAAARKDARERFEREQQRGPRHAV